MHILNITLGYIMVSARVMWKESCIKDLLPVQTHLYTDQRAYLFLNTCKSFARELVTMMRVSVPLMSFHFFLPIDGKK